MRISYSTYTLSFKHLTRSRQGALIRIEDEREGIVGYADLHPWEELCDPSLELLLSSLDCDISHKMLEIAFANAYEDGVARKKGYSLLKNCMAIKNHYLIAAASLLHKEEIESAIEKGFTHLKVKIGKEWRQEIEPLVEAMSCYPQLRWRLDANEKIPEEEAEPFMRSLSHCCDKIDYIEDITRYEGSLWHSLQEKWGITLACDNAADLSTALKEGIKVIIVKPAKTTIAEISRYALYPVRWVFTSYLDHPVGVAASWYHATQWYKKTGLLPQICGMASHSVYKEEPFSSALGAGPQLTAPSGTGWGWDELLEELAWKEISLASSIS